MLSKVDPDGRWGLFSYLALGPGGSEAWLRSLLQVGLNLGLRILLRVNAIEDKWADSVPASVSKVYQSDQIKGILRKICQKPR